MAEFRFSRRAEKDLLNIADYTLRKWGKIQVARYLGELEERCQMLADNPALGRFCDYIRPGLRRHEHGKHVLFYRKERGGILVSRVLHQRMLPERHAIDDEDVD
jgi:toxin ParE1/3/4